MSLPIRAATLSDVVQLDRIEQEAFSTPWSLSLLRAAVLNLNYEVRVMRSGTGNVVAFYIAHTHRAHSNLDNLAVDMPARGQGLGEALLEDWVTRARLRSMSRLTLQVRTDNDVAQRLYRKFAFSRTRLLECYYPDGSHAYQMERLLVPRQSRAASRVAAAVGQVTRAAGTW